MRLNIAPWLRNTITLPECAGHLNPANNTSAWKKNSWLWQILKNACTGCMPRNLRVSRSSPNKLVAAQRALQTLSKYPPAEPGALGLEPLEAAGPCCINPHSYSHCAMPPQEPSVLLRHPYLTFW